MIEIYLVLQLAVTIEPALTLKVLTTLVGLVGKGAFAYYWINRIKKKLNT
ncbi:hypothetical protein [Pseudoalteromonas sp. JC28]|nr:hypothetical protein [Pseudoalteromonas sp. JC28]